MARKSTHRQWYCMSIRLRWLTWDPDHGLITLKWTKFEKKVSWTFIYIDLNYFSPRGFNMHKVKTEEWFCLLSPPLFHLLCCLGVEVFKKKKKKERKNSLGHLAEDLTCSLAVRAEAENALFPTLAIFMLRGWEVKRCPYRWKPSSLPHYVCACSVEQSGHCADPPRLLSAYTPKIR